MNWFEKLTGFCEENPEQVRSMLNVADGLLFSEANGRSYRCGTLETPALAELRKLTAALPVRDSLPLRVSEIVGDVQEFHQNGDHDGALFQVASQFNLLEMVGPNVPPEHGVGIYEHDRTQGPACAIACGAATIFRNYFADVDGQKGQTAERQIDCLRDLGDAIGNADGSLWKMRNGYALASESGLRMIASALSKATEDLKNGLRSKLRIGVQWDAGVTLGGSSNVVSQAFCSALPVAYSSLSASLWEPFARLVLEGTYEATLHAALLNRERTGSSEVFLTLVGGGAFGNRMDWITDAMERSFGLMRDTGLDVRIVSYGSATPEIYNLLS